MATSSAAARSLDWAEAQSAECRLCPRDCRADRRAGELGRCGAGPDAAFYMDYVHYGEEAELVPSHTVYLTGCNLRCVFCHTAEERRTRPARRLTPAALGELVERGRAQGARNLNLLGGEPTVNLPALLRLLAAVRDVPPVVWNTNLYATGEALARLEGLVEVWLADLKFGSAACGERLAGAADYWDVARARLGELDAARTIVRHLVLPGHLDCCTRPVLEWLAAELPNVRVSLKLDYLVMPAARADADIGRFLTREEARRAGELAGSLGLRLVPQAEIRAGEGGPDTSEVEMEVVISPEGAVYLRHPTGEAAALARGLRAGPAPPEEKR